jgi:hypothetical protein
MAQMPMIPSPSGELTQRRRQPFVSRHREVLDHIRYDSVHSRIYPVPQTDSSHDADSHSGRRLCAKYQRSCLNFFSNNKSCSDWLKVVLPAWRWLKVYDFKTTFVQDLIAGMSVGVMVVPQSMSYAKLAGLPVEYGLYSALVPVYAYALWGSSRQLAVGPVAIVSLLLSSGLSQIMRAKGLAPGDENYQELYIRFAIQTSKSISIQMRSFRVV